MSAISGARVEEAEMPLAPVLRSRSMPMLAMLLVLKPKPMVLKSPPTMIRTKPPMSLTTMQAEADARAMQTGPRLRI